MWAQESIKVGVLTIRSGPGAPVGDDILSGIQTATRLQGAVLGRPVELIVEDSLWNPQQAVTKATKLVQQNRVVAILGTSTIEALALLPVADRLGVPIVTSNAGAAAITRDRCSRWVFRTNPDELMPVASLKHLIVQRAPALQNAKWFTIGHDYPWSRLVGGSVKSVKDLKYVGETFAPLDTTDWAPFIAQARTAGATAVVMPVTLGTPLLQFIQQAQEFGLTRDAVLISPIGLPDWLVDKLGETSTRVVSAGSWAAWRYEEERAGDEAVQRGIPPPARPGVRHTVVASRHGRPDALRRHHQGGVDGPGDRVKARGRRAAHPGGAAEVPGGRPAAESPLFLGPYESVAPPRYGARFAQRAEAFPARKSLTVSAQESGCSLK